MVEQKEDTTGHFPNLFGAELDEWRILKAQFNLTDSIDIFDSFEGSRFTWRRIVIGSLIQSRIDRLYFSNFGWWVPSFIQLRHAASQVLSDHDPVIVDIANTSGPREDPLLARSSYFKADSSILHKVENLKLLQKEWEDHRPDSLDVRKRFFFASQRLRKTYKQLQREARTLPEHIAQLKRDITSLKELTCISDAQITELHCKRNELRDFEFK